MYLCSCFFSQECSCGRGSDVLSNRTSQCLPKIPKVQVVSVVTTNEMVLSGMSGVAVIAVSNIHELPRLVSTVPMNDLNPH